MLHLLDRGPAGGVGLSLRATRGGERLLERLHLAPGGSRGGLRGCLGGGPLLCGGRHRGQALAQRRALLHEHGLHLLQDEAVEAPAIRRALLGGRGPSHLQGVVQGQEGDEGTHRRDDVLGAFLEDLLVLLRGLVEALALGLRLLLSRLRLRLGVQHRLERLVRLLERGERRLVGLGGGGGGGGRRGELLVALLADALELGLLRLDRLELPLLLRQGGLLRRLDLGEHAADHADDALLALVPGVLRRAQAARGRGDQHVAAALGEVLRLLSDHLDDVVQHLLLGAAPRLLRRPRRRQPLARRALVGLGRHGSPGRGGCGARERGGGS
mmetsp:Transcript_33698/g.100037  ORF Transcript_33698/g.100037 Transcript_33698/m.100037 type:complete len:327 (+) Transcript_33698:289-1269(+)